jgi:flagellum-specific peptidoglycan hydrolase FlgJ
MKTKEEYTTGTLTTIRDNFRVYDNMADGVRGYFDFISTPRYANLRMANTPREYLEMIKADGYATSSSYVANNMRVVESYGLMKYDGASVEYTIPTRIIKRGSRGNDAKWVQAALNRHGYS